MNMLQEERINEIRNMILANKKVLVNDLCEKFNVSDVTIRKDLLILQKEGLIKKIYGGALLNEQCSLVPNRTMQLESTNNDVNHIDEKEKVAELAISQLSDNDTIFLGSGTTCCLLAKKLHKYKNLTIVTNNISALQDLLSFPCKLFIVGGEVTSVDSCTYFSSLENASEYLRSIHFSKAFTSCTGLDLSVGITVNSMISTYIFRALSQMNQNWYMMVNHNKFNRTGIYKVAELEQIHCFICDDVPSDYKNYFEQKQIMCIHK
jgi:DeoR/GlpR family transcriptional regulator of sugar metabolism